MKKLILTALMALSTFSLVADDVYPAKLLFYPSYKYAYWSGGYPAVDDATLTYHDCSSETELLTKRPILTYQKHEHKIEFLKHPDYCPCKMEYSTPYDKDNAPFIAIQTPVDMAVLWVDGHYYEIEFTYHSPYSKNKEKNNE